MKLPLLALAVLTAVYRDSGWQESWRDAFTSIGFADDGRAGDGFVFAQRVFDFGKRARADSAVFGDRRPRLAGCASTSQGTNTANGCISPSRRVSNAVRMPTPKTSWPSWKKTQDQPRGVFKTTVCKREHHERQVCF